MRLTLSADHDEGYLRDGPVCGELVVDFVNFLEAGLIFQTENQDDSIHPTSKLERRGGGGAVTMQEEQVDQEA